MANDKSLLEFPCDFTLKIIGQGAADFEQIVALIVQKHIPDLRENALQPRPSKESKYLAITATVYVTSQQQLDDLYRELTAHEKIIMVL